MRIRGLLAIILLAVGLCFVPALGYGEVKGIEALNKLSGSKVSFIQHLLLGERVNYIMRNPTSFLYVDFVYDEDGTLGRSLETVGLAEGIDTKEKIVIDITDTRGVFSGKSGAALLSEFKNKLKHIYLYVRTITWNMDTDIVAKFWSKEGDFLGYFYQGEYYLWEKQG